MHQSNSLRVRILTTAALLAMATVLAACAGTSTASGPVGGGGRSTPPTGIASGGQLELTVIDQTGAPLDQAEITVVSLSGASYRVRGRTSRSGMASFSRVPAQVRVQIMVYVTRQIRESSGLVRTVTYRGNGEEQVEVQDVGITPLRITIELVEVQ
jgi:hypothetical protein